MASNRAAQARSTPATQTQTETGSDQAAAPPAPILRLRGSHTSRRRVQWTEDVVDNEKLNRKKSKVCCIYHRPKAVDESSDESSSSSDSDSDSDAGRNPKDPHGDECSGHGHSHWHNGRPKKRRGDADKRNRRPSPNAYERVPKVKTPKQGNDESGGGEAKEKP